VHSQASRPLAEPYIPTAKQALWMPIVYNAAIYFGLIQHKKKKLSFSQCLAIWRQTQVLICLDIVVIHGQARS